jgi:hypothetical protein
VTGRAGTRARVLRWSAWAPGRESREAWEAWCGSPEPLAPEGHPDARFLPAMLRRRCSPLTRIVLTAAFGCLEEGLRSGVRTVFASRHGSVNESIDLLRCIVRGERISPAIFSHTVHNAQAGLYCIATGNRQGSSSVAARADTFGCGYLEALTHLERDPGRPVLYVMGDVGLAPIFSEMVEQPPGSYAVAVLLAREGDGPALDLAFGGSPPVPSRPWPDAAEFLRWLVADEGAPLSLGRFRWSRG